MANTSSMMSSHRKIIGARLFQKVLTKDGRTRNKSRWRNSYTGSLFDFERAFYCVSGTSEFRPFELDAEEIVSDTKNRKIIINGKKTKKAAVQAVAEALQAILFLRVVKENRIKKPSPNPLGKSKRIFEPSLPLEERLKNYKDSVDKIIALSLSGGLKRPKVDDFKVVYCRSTEINIENNVSDDFPYSGKYRKYPKKVYRLKIFAPLKKMLGLREFIIMNFEDSISAVIDGLSTIDIQPVDCAIKGVKCYQAKWLQKSSRAEFDLVSGFIAQIKGDENASGSRWRERKETTYHSTVSLEHAINGVILKRKNQIKNVGITAESSLDKKLAHVAELLKSYANEPVYFSDSDAVGNCRSGALSWLNEAGINTEKRSVRFLEIIKAYKMHPISEAWRTILAVEKRLKNEAKQVG